DALLDTADGHPQRTMLLAHEIWNATPEGGIADEGTFDAGLWTAMASVTTEFSELWARMPAIERQVLAALANGTGPYSRAVPAGTRGRSTKTTIDALIARGDVTQTRSPRKPGTGYQIVDPLLSEWIRRGRPEV
ncbi:MAG: hypothetical protein ACYDB7_11435, partial [Mycobacteriales bacterium]